MLWLAGSFRVCAVGTALAFTSTTTTTTTAWRGAALVPFNDRVHQQHSYRNRNALSGQRPGRDYEDGDTFGYRERSTSSGPGSARGQRGGRHFRDGSSNSNSNNNRSNHPESYEAEDRRRRRHDGSISRNRYDRDDYGYAGGGGGNLDGDGYGRNTGSSARKGRRRYSADGRKERPQQRGGGRGNRRRRGGDSHRREEPERQQRRRERPPTPPLGSRPTYFTCRHTYEACLREELERSLGAAASGRVSFGKPHPGLMVVLADDEETASLVARLRPSYALQVLPSCVLVKAESIKGLARAVLGSSLLRSGGGGGDDDDDNDGGGFFLLRPDLLAAPKGSLAIHALVPEMGRGMPEPQLPQHRRATKIGEEIAAQLRKRCRAARAVAAADDGGGGERWLLQVLLLEPDVVAASLARCNPPPAQAQQKQQQQRPPNWTWPNWHLPAGLAHVELDDEDGGDSSVVVPSSAYRKLLEAFWYLGDRPPPGGIHPVVDLGACPGGWTGALRRMGCKVLAVDRSPLDPSLAADTEGIGFVRGDAFRFVPPWVGEGGAALEEPLPNTWMVSDIIAYPDKILELLDRWCGNRWVSHAIVTVKFQSEIPWEDVETAAAIAGGHGYRCRTVHFFNNKNEVTLLAVRDGHSGIGSNNNNNDNNNALLGRPMYAPVLPTTKKK